MHTRLPQGIWDMFDWTVNLGNALTIVSFIGGGIIFVVTIRGRVDALTGRISFVEQELKKLLEVLIEQTRHSERMTAMSARMLALEQRHDQLAERVNRRLNHIDDEQ